MIQNRKIYQKRTKIKKKKKNMHMNKERNDSKLSRGGAFLFTNQKKLMNQHNAS